MESSGRRLFNNQPRDKPAVSHFLVCHRLSLVTYDARWLATPSSSWWGYIRAWTPSLETGEGGSSRWLRCCRSPDAFHVHKGLIWFAIATIAEFIQVVSLADRLTHPLSLISIYSVVVLDFGYKL